MLTEKEYQHVIKQLQSADVMDRSRMLQILQDDACNDERILPYLEILTKD